MGVWQGEDSEPLWDIVFEPVSEVWMPVAIAGHESGQFGFGGFKR